MATRFYDFSEYSVGTLGTHWAEHYNATTAWTSKIYDVSGNKVARVESNEGGAGWYALKNTEIGSVSGDLEIAAYVKAIGSYAAGDPFGIGLLSVAATRDAYGPMPYGAAWYGQWYHNGSAWSNLGGPLAYPAPAANTYFWFRYGRSGSTIRGKVWTGASTDEPLSWQVSATDTNITNLYAGFIAYSTNFEIDLFGIGTAGDTAPTSGGGGGGGSAPVLMGQIVM